MEEFDFATVIYKEELNILRAQARSFAVHLSPTMVRNIFLVINDFDLTADDLVEIVDLYGPLSARVRILDRAVVAPKMYAKTHGWWGQQIVKLRLCQHATSRYVIILDSKNHFIRPVSPDHFVTRDGRIMTSLVSYVNNAEDHCRGSFAYFGMDATPYIGALPPSITPITLRREIVLQMIEFIEKRANTNFEVEFLKHSNTTEFILYYAFLIFCGRTIETEYVVVEPQVATLFLDKVRDENRFDSIMFQACRRSPIAFGIHRAAVRELTAHQIGRILELWKATGLHISEDESMRWLTPGASVPSSGLRGTSVS